MKVDAFNHKLDIISYPVHYILLNLQQLLSLEILWYFIITVMYLK